MNQELRDLNAQQNIAEWVERVADCRNSGQTVQAWCEDHGLSTKTYYKWQKRVFLMAKAQQGVDFVEATPIVSRCKNLDTNIAVTIHTVNTELSIHNGADSAMVATVLRMMKLC